MKVSEAQAWLLFLFLVHIDRNQVSALCSEPKVLCCPGRNDSCSQGCFCDEFCVTSHDCCSDYNQTCKQPSSPTSSSSSPSPFSSPPLSYSSSTSSFSPSSQAPPPSSSSSPTINQSPSSTSASLSTSVTSSTPHQKENIRVITVFHMGVRTTANEEAMLKSVQAFALHLEGLMRQRCEGCSLRVQNISKKYP